MLVIPPAATVVLVVFAAWTAGTAALNAVVRLDGQVQPGHFKVTWPVCAGLAALTALARPLWWIVVVLCLAAFASIYIRLDRLGAWVAAGAASVALAFTLRPGRVWVPLTAAVYLGAVTNAMLLGHWHLNQPRLGTGPLRRLVWALWAGTAVFVAACVALFVTTSSPSGRAGALTAIAFSVFVGVLNVMVTHLVKTRSIMSATGILYLQVLLVFVAAFTGVLGSLA